MRNFRSLLLGLGFGLLVGTSPVAALCGGDCNGDGLVTVDEIVRSVGLALGDVPYRLCPPGDGNADGSLTVDEIIVAIGTALGGCPETVAVYRAPELVAPTGPDGENGRAVLPSGRRIEPAGTQVGTETLPLNLALTPDGRHLLITNDGYGDNADRQFVQILDTDTLAMSKVEVPHFFGLAVSPDGTRAFVGSDRRDNDRIEALQIADGALVRESAPVAELPSNLDFPMGLALSPDGNFLYALGMLTNSFVTIDTTDGSVHPLANQVGNHPYSIAVTPDGKRAFVSSWGVNNGNPTDLVPPPLPPVALNAQERNSIAVLDLADPTAPRILRYMRVLPSLRADQKEIHGTAHPSAMQLSPDGKLLYVTATNLDVLVVFDTTTYATVAEVPLNVFESGPVRGHLQGLYPNALAIRPDGRRLYVADAGINAVQVVDIDPEARTFVTAGFIPAGFYPTALALSPDGSRLYIANGKGSAMGPNAGPAFDELNSPTNYIAQLVRGSVSIVDDVDGYDVAAGTEKVIALSGFDPVEVTWVDGEPSDADQVQRSNPVPIDFGSGPSDKIKYVVHILKENRTYDQVFGALPGGNGDPELAIYGQAVTPNHFALATQFGTGDNYFEEGEVSTPGHEWIDQANCNDWTQKLWPSNYDRNIGSGVLEQGLEGFAKSGFFWERLDRLGIEHIVFGETLSILSRFATGVDGAGVTSVAVPLVDAFGRFPSVTEVFYVVNGDIDRLREIGADVDKIQNELFPKHVIEFPSNIIAERTDIERAEIFGRYLDKWTTAGEMPQYVHIWVPNDHTFGGGAGAPTPRSAIADNDAGLGLIVEALSKSPFWPQMAIFVTEDDAQDGVDHVSAYRTIQLVISPYAKRGYISKVHHSNMSMTKTMSLILGATPMSQYDRYATDMRDYFQTEPDLTPYTALPRAFPPEYNTTAAAAPNEYLRQAAELSEDLELEFYDTAGADLPRVLQLIYRGEQLEIRKRQMQTALTALLAMLLVGFVISRIDRRVPEAPAQLG